MYQFTFSFMALAGLALTPVALARDVPSNVRSFYETLKSRGHCTNTLATGFYSSNKGSDSMCILEIPRFGDVTVLATTLTESS
jgi:hypothetical protein